MRQNLFVLLSITLLAAGCSRSDCLPETEVDASPPGIRIVVEYGSRSGGRQTAEHSSGQPGRAIEADGQHPVIITFAASDSSGMRTLSPGMTLQQTVGIGVERRNVRADPIRSNCPRAALSYRHEIPGTGTSRTLLVTAGAENWAGLAASLEPLTIRLSNLSEQVAAPPVLRRSQASDRK